MKKKAPNYDRKAQVLKLGIDKDIREIEGLIYRYRVEGNIEAEMNVAKILIDRIEEWGFDLWVEGRRINSAFYARKTRLWKYIYAMMLQSDPVVFLTFTFTDKVFDKTSYETRKKYVQRFLKDQAAYYIANIDFGEENGREHYHAIAIGHFDYGSWHKYGSIKGLPVRRSVDDAKRLSKYVSKLTNHAIKNTTGAVRVIYSRNLPQLVSGLADGSIPLYTTVRNEVKDSPKG